MTGLRRYETQAITSTFLQYVLCTLYSMHGIFGLHLLKYEYSNVLKHRILQPIMQYAQHELPFPMG